MVRKIVIVIALMALLSPGFLLPSVVKAWWTDNLYVLTEYQVPDIWEDAFWNYDFESDYPYNDNVDWPVTIVFTEHADVDKVKNALWGNANTHSEMWLELNNWWAWDPFAWEWHKNRGTKGQHWATGKDCHMRPYAVYDWETDRYQMCNTPWYYYCIGTTHGDEFHFPDLVCGWSQEREYLVCDQIQHYHPTWTVYQYAYYFQNYEYWRVEQRPWWWFTEYHIGDNDGWVSRVHVP